MKINSFPLQFLLVLILISFLGKEAFAQKNNRLSKKEMTERLLALETENKQLAEALSNSERKIAQLQDSLKAANKNTLENDYNSLIDPATAAKMVFKEQSFDFGTIEEGEKVEHFFLFTNNSQNPLIISNARGSCGCTVPEWPKGPIASGETGKIKVRFDSKGKRGKQTKTITISANTIPLSTILSINANVIKLDDK